MKSADREFQENCSDSGKWIAIPHIRCSISGNCMDTSCHLVQTVTVCIFMFSL